MALTSLPPSAIVVAPPQGGRSVIALCGEMDAFSRPGLWDALLSQINDLGGGDVVIDLTETTFIDSASVRSLARAQHALERQGRILTLRSPSRSATRVLQVFELTDLIETPEPLPGPLPTTS